MVQTVLRSSGGGITKEAGAAPFMPFRFGVAPLELSLKGAIHKETGVNQLLIVK